MQKTNKYILDENGAVQPCHDFMTWAKWFENSNEKRIIAKDKIGDSTVSTVFLGLDHSFTDSDIPVLWETMIFGGKHNDYLERYSSKEDAIKGHNEAVELVKNNLQE